MNDGVMTWDELVANFRALGGIADNVRLGEGKYGRGIFPIDPSQPVRLLIPHALMIPVRDTELRNGELTVRSGAARKKDTQFFDAYQRSFGWSEGAREESLATQQAWHELPESSVTALKGAGIMELPKDRFDAPNDELALQQHILSRSFLLNGSKRFFPMVELVNHQSNGAEYVSNDRAVGVEGTFADEVVVRYNTIDAIGFATTFSFADRSVFAHCVGANLKFPGMLELTVLRDIYKGKEKGGVTVPQTKVLGKGHLELSSLTLVNTAAPDAPRAIFKEVTTGLIAADVADVVFSAIVLFNIQRLRELLEVLQKHDSALTQMLSAATAHQLAALEGLGC